MQGNSVSLVKRIMSTTLYLRNEPNIDNHTGHYRPSLELFICHYLFEQEQYLQTVAVHIVYTLRGLNFRKNNNCESERFSLVRK